MSRKATLCLSMMVLAAGVQAQTVTVLSTDFTGRTVANDTASSIPWTTNGVTDPGSMTVDAPDGLFDTADAAGFFAVDRNTGNEGAWTATFGFDATADISLEQLELIYRHFNNSGGFQGVDRIVNWTVTVTGSVSGEVGSAQALGAANMQGTENIVFSPVIPLTSGESYTVTILAEGGNTDGNNTGIDSLSFRGVIAVPEVDQGNEIWSNVNPPFIDEGTTVILTGPEGTNHKWMKNGEILEGETERELVFNPVKVSDEGEYTVEYDDGTKVIMVSEPYFLSVLPSGSVPVAGLAGLALLAGVGALGGARLVHRRK